MSQQATAPAAPNYGATSSTQTPLDTVDRHSGRVSALKWLKFRSSSSGKLWSFYATIMTLAFVARVSLILPNGLKLNISREEYFYYRIPFNKYPLLVHISTALFAGLLAVFQFIPRVRYHWISYHRNAGRVVNTFIFISTLTGWSIARISLGGDLSIQLGIYVLGFMILSSTIISWRAIHQLQIDEHRKWIIRAWGYQMSVVTLRLIMTISMGVIGWTGGFFTTMSCAQIAYSIDDPVLFAREYPQCLPGSTGKPTTHVSIEAGLESDLAVVAGAQATFGMSIWVALWIHAIAVEYYLSKTKQESDRLREVSAKRQNINRRFIGISGDVAK